MIAEQKDGQGKVYNHYDVHNLYGWSETLATLPAVRALENKRSVVISRSTFPTSGAYAGHWLGDNTSRWPHLKYNIIGMLEFNLFGIPYIGADICGFLENRTEQMCQRWMQLGAFNPFFRNHNGIRFEDQDPGSFSPSVVDSNRRVVETRYTLIPFLYTLFHRVHISGGTVVRSMAHEFPSDSTCWSLDEQFLWGSSLLIAPVIYENHTIKEVYLPSLNERWFNYYTGEEQSSLGNITVTADYDYIPLFLRGGAILPRQQSAMNTVKARLTPMNLIIALDKQEKAQGNLFWDDGDSIETYETSNYNYFYFNYDSQTLSIVSWTYKYPQMGYRIKLEEIIIYGLINQPTKIQWNGQRLSSTKWLFNSTRKVLKMQRLALDFSQRHKFYFS
jgi:maltase-glucoamylase